MQAIKGMLVGLVAVSALLMSSAPAVAQQAGAARFKPLARSSGPIATLRQPLSLLAQQRVRVVVQMDVASVAEVRANAAGHLISDTDHAAIHTQIDRQQATIEPAIVARGGTILAHYHDAMNGIKVEIARSEIAGLAGLPGVVQVASVSQYALKNVVSVPFIGAPQVWQGTPGFRGEHVKIAIIDTGIDYTHANFGGPGTVAAFMNAAANSTAPADPTLFGPNAPKVKGGTDLVGDNYDASTPANSTPVPDPNPLDCNGHGSHVAGTAAGFGVANDGTTFHGPYDAAVYAAGFGIGPGVAPLADLYAVRVFGCTGTTDVVTEGIDWAVHNNMDVINMSLGAPFGPANSSDAIAADNAAKAGIVVAVAAGNEGPAPYVTGTPASATHAISVAATDARQFLVNGVRINLSSGGGANGVDANALNLPSGSIPAVILTDTTTASGLSLGCNASDYPASGAAGAIVIVSRGTCTFDAKASNAMAAGAVAIGVVNNGAGFFNPALSGVTIPFIVLLQSDAATFASAPSPDTATVAFANVPDAGYRVAASFSSGGPRTGDGALKPNITGPGVNVFSTAIGTGTGGTYDSGTSMATPHVAGVSALAVQAHRGWTEPGVRAAVVETASPSALGDYSPRIEGAGLVQAVGATSTDVTVHGSEDRGLGLLSFGVAEFTRDYHDGRDLIVRNHGQWPATFAATATPVGGVPHTLKLSPTVSVRGHDEASLHVSLTVPVSTVGSTHDASGNDRFAEVAGYITLQPESSANHGVTLQLPYYLVPRARSDVDADLRLGRNPHIRLSNRGGAIAGNGDFYAWGIKNPKTGAIEEGFEPRAIGVQTNPISATDSILVFAVNSYGRFSNPAAGEYDMYIDVNGDGVPDFVLFAADSGLVETGEANGQMATFLVNLATGTEIATGFIVDAPTDGSIVLMPVLASNLGISPANPRFSYNLNAFDGNGAEESVPGIASFNAFSPSVSNAMFVPVAPGATVDVPVAIDPVEFQLTPALGFMVVTEDNLSGGSEANLAPLPH